MRRMRGKRVVETERDWRFGRSLTSPPHESSLALAQAAKTRETTLKMVSRSVPGLQKSDLPHVVLTLDEATSLRIWTIKLCTLSTSSTLHSIRVYSPRRFSSIDTLRPNCMTRALGLCNARAYQTWLIAGSPPALEAVAVAVDY